MSPMNSWKSMGPVVVSALKLGAMDPRRRLCEENIEVSIEYIDHMHMYHVRCRPLFR